MGDGDPVEVFTQLFLLLYDLVVLPSCKCEDAQLDCRPSFHLHSALVSKPKGHSCEDFKKDASDRPHIHLLQDLIVI